MDCNNCYTGATTVSGGTLVINGSISTTSITTVTGTLFGLAQGLQFDMAGQRWAIFYNADSGLNTFGGGNDVAIKAIVVAAVPEPSTVLPGALGLFALLLRRRA